jgi:hypothetical protein
LELFQDVLLSASRLAPLTFSSQEDAIAGLEDEDPMEDDEETDD